jgi:uncharacterized membrane protein
MKSRVRVLGHPLHPMLIVFPLGLLATAAIFDILHLIDREGPWAFLSFYLIAAGLIGGLVAASVGVLDWLEIPMGSRAKKIGLMHALANSVVMIVFFFSWLLRRDLPAAPDTIALLLSFIGVGVALLGGWLGGELVYRLSIGVDPEAHLNASNSLNPDMAGSRSTAGD